VTGVDSSQEMLSLARQRDGAANGASFLHGDIRDLRVQGPFQAVCCFGDVLNHMLAADEVLATLASAYRVLAPRGWLVCDTNSLDTFRSSMWNNQLPLSFWQGKRIRTRCVFDEEEGLGHMECQVYEIGQDLEMHHLIERYHDHLTMHGWLSQVGFTQIERCDFHPLDLSDSYPEIGVLKSLWTARKPG
jgi:ubiquinone/menaquinone biosynthesis C-methylase UbiE